MPIYKFLCKECGKEFESLMRPYDPVHCPHCGVSEAEKLFTTFSNYRINGNNGASTRPNFSKKGK
jgi:putative FmdB family regulatory protein